MKYVIEYSILNIQTFNAAAWFVEQNLKDIYIVTENNEDLILQLKKHYSIRVEKKPENNDNTTLKSIAITIDHKKPITRIGNISRPLFFPKIIVKNYYKDFEDKLNQVYFRGIFTYSRMFQVISLFMKIRAYLEIFVLVKNVILLKKKFSIESSKVIIIFTREGRINQSKFLNKDYFNELSAYKFIFCPSGDFKWTYRFFETVLVGSIPITSVDVPIYKDYLKLTSLSEKIDINRVTKNRIKCQELYEN